MRTELTTFTCDHCGLREEFKGIVVDDDPQGAKSITIRTVKIHIELMHGLNETFQRDLCLRCRQSLYGAISAWDVKRNPNQGD